MMAPRATQRLQLHESYTLDDAQADLPYFSLLGISHLYLSPVSTSRPGSTHGYDVVDHGTVDAARGGEAALRRLAAGARDAGMGILLDIVPNHMASHPLNAWWWDVLKHGRASRWAQWFDIDWEAPALAGRLLAPFLEKPYGDALCAGDIRLQHDEALGWHLAAHGQPYPLAPDSWVAAASVESLLHDHDPASAGGRARLHALLERQHYRLAWWRCAAEIINWRRFFEVSELVGLRVERQEVFEAVHALPLRLYAEGLIDGLRIDHVDGLARPLAYCRRLREAMRATGRDLSLLPGDGEPWIVVEKILAHGEGLDARWHVSGTTGYDFAADVGALLHDGAGEDRLFAGWAEFSGDDRRPSQWMVQARLQMLERHFAAERNALLDVLAGLARRDADTRDWTRPAIGRALDALLCRFPTYRNYVEDGARSPVDQPWFQRALAGALAMAREDDGLHEPLLVWLDHRLGGSEANSDEEREARRRFQQLTPPLAAKSLEDTVFYRYGNLLSRNEVGSEPDVFSLSIDGFHEANLRRAKAMPLGLLATATHDHKRGEDVRARLAVLSEIPDEWLRECRGWLAAGDEGMPEAGPGVAFRYMLLQTLAGAWPPALHAGDAGGVARYLERIGDWAVKALREGKQLSSWFHPDEEREAVHLAWLESLAPGAPRHGALRDIEAFVRRIEPAAIGNGLIQAALRMTCPGIPDLYQGTEFRDFSLVDPDNRRPVDYAARTAAIDETWGGGDDGAVGMPRRTPFEPGAWPAAAWSDGRIKQALVATLLALRRERAGAFSGDYRPLTAQGLHDTRLLAFCRGAEVVVVAGVKCASLLRAGPDGMPVLPQGHWSAATLSPPDGAGDWYDALRGRPLPAGRPWPLAEVLAGFPLAILVRRRAGG